MRVIVATCDRYDHLMPGFAHQFNKYWGTDQVVDVLGFRQPPRQLPDNFVFHQMEPVETRSWTANLRMFMESIQDPHFTFLLDDYWLTEPVDKAAVTTMERFVIAGAVKGDLSENTLNFAHSKLSGGFVLASPNAHYRTSTQPCVWSRRYMLNLLQGDLNPWQFELQDNPKISEGRIVGPSRQIFRFANIYFKGSPAGYMIDKINADDHAELRALGMFEGIC